MWLFYYSERLQHFRSWPGSPVTLAVSCLRFKNKSRFMCSLWLNNFLLVHKIVFENKFSLQVPWRQTPHRLYLVNRTSFCRKRFLLNHSFESKSANIYFLSSILWQLLDLSKHYNMSITKSRRTSTKNTFKKKYTYSLFIRCIRCFSIWFLWQGFSSG